MLTRQYKLQDGRVLCALIELDMWSLWIDGEAESQVVGAPLTGVLMEVLGLNPAHDEPDEEVTSLARSIQEDFPGFEAAISEGA